MERNPDDLTTNNKKMDLWCLSVCIDPRKTPTHTVYNHYTETPR